LAVSGEVVRGWEAGSVTIPPGVAADVTWRVKMAAREEFALREGLNCPWVDEFRRTPPADHDTQALLARVEEFKEHQKTCAKCIERERTLTARFGVAPVYPMREVMRDRVSKGEAWAMAFLKWPKWAQVAVIVIVFFGIRPATHYLLDFTLGKGGLVGLSAVAAAFSCALSFGILAPLPTGRDRWIRILAGPVFVVGYLLLAMVASDKYAATMEATPHGAWIVEASALAGLLLGAYFRLRRHSRSPA
jgi:hypothetical protein